MKKLKDIKADEGGIKAQILADADGDIDYVKTIAEHGCSGGSCNNLIYYSDTHAFTAKHMDEINEILQDEEDSTGLNTLTQADAHGDIFNWLAWFAYEYRAHEIMREIDPNY